MPSTSALQTLFNQYAADIHPHYRNSIKANFNHLVNGGVLPGGQTLACYLEYTVSEYLLGSGPTTITVVYDNLAKTRSYSLYALAHATGHYGTGPKMTEAQYDAASSTALDNAKRDVNSAIGTNRTVVFLTPMLDHNVIVVEAWQVVAQWDIQTINGAETAVRYGMEPDADGASEPLAAFKTRVTTAAGSDGMSGERLTRAGDLRIHYRDMGVYGKISAEGVTQVHFSPAQPPVMADNQQAAAPRNKPGMPRIVFLTWNEELDGVWITWCPPPPGEVVDSYVIFRTRDDVRNHPQWWIGSKQGPNGGAVTTLSRISLSLARRRS